MSVNIKGADMGCKYLNKVFIENEIEQAGLGVPHSRFKIKDKIVYIAK